MKNFKENPFADYGRIVTDDRFVGRHSDIAVIESRVIQPSEPGNLAIIGEPRIGKSSLAYHTIMERRQELVQRYVLPVWVNIGTFEDPDDLFRALVEDSLDEIQELGWLTEPISYAAEEALRLTQTWGSSKKAIERYFGKVKSAGIHPLFIMDEFDDARDLFRNGQSRFQELRELSYQPKWRVGYVVTSRRTIREIELQSQAISTFDGIFLKHYLTPFTAHDLLNYYERCARYGLEFTDAEKDRMDYYCGGQPYLMDLLGYEIYELRQKADYTSVDAASVHAMQSIVTQYDRIISLIRDDTKLDKLMQILFGPVVDVNQTDVDEFLQYGTIKRTEKGYRAFSEHFQTYLRLLEREGSIDLWPVWREAEISLRRLIASRLTAEYGPEWLEPFLKANSKLRKTFEKCEEAQRRESGSFGSRASTDPLDYTYPQDLFAIMFAKWDLFRDVLGKDKNYWNQRASLLAKIRNPLAHNRDSALQDYERHIAEGYCQEIITLTRSGLSYNL